MYEHSSDATFATFVQKLKAHGAAPAITDASTGETLTYETLHDLIETFVRTLPRSVAPGQRVVFHGIPPLSFVPLFFAAIIRGAVVVPLDSRVSREFIDSVIESVDPVLLITGTTTDVQTSVTRVLYTDIVLQNEEQEIMRVDDPDAPAEILFTSGTWARPKGVVLSQRNILSNARQVLSVYDHRKDDTSLAVLPLSHAYQQTVGLILPMLVGSHIVFLSQLNSESLMRAIATYRVRTMLAVPRLLSLIENGILRSIPRRWRSAFVRGVRMCRYLPRTLRRLFFWPVHRKIGGDLRTFVVGGAPTDSSLDHFFQGLGYRVLIGYGASECAPTISVSFDQRRRHGEIGSPLPGMDIRLSNDGEIIVRGENIFLGYWPDIARPAEFNTEDVADMHDGILVLKGRTKNLIIFPSGDKAFSEDIEYIGRMQAGVEDCCVVSEETGTRTMVHCLVRGDAEVRVRLDSIRNAMNAQLPFGVRVDRMMFAEKEDFPYTHTLKPNRKAVLDMVLTSARALHRD